MDTIITETEQPVITNGLLDLLPGIGLCTFLYRNKNVIKDPYIRKRLVR